MHMHMTYIHAHDMHMNMTYMHMHMHMFTGHNTYARAHYGTSYLGTDGRWNVERCEQSPIDPRGKTRARRGRREPKTSGRCRNRITYRLIGTPGSRVGPHCTATGPETACGSGWDSGRTEWSNPRAPPR